MSSQTRIPTERLRRRCDLAELNFETTAELEVLSEALGQGRALEALHFGIGVRQAGYNLYVLGAPGVGKSEVVRRTLEERAASEPPPSDWCYVNNFDDPRKPVALELPAGSAGVLRRDLDQLVELLRQAIPAAFESEVYRTRVNEIEEAFKQRQEEAFDGVRKQAEEQGMAILHTPNGFGIAPVQDGEVISPEDFKKLPEERRHEIEQTVERLRGLLTQVLLQAPDWQKEQRRAVERVNREIAMAAIKAPIDELREKYHERAAIVAYLDGVEGDVLAHLVEFAQRPSPQDNPLGLPTPPSEFFRRYSVNVMVEHGEARGVPVVLVDKPGYPNLVGRVEHTSQMGTLITDFTHIRPGALHRANGGYLVLEVERLLVEPYAWQGLKRVLSAGRIGIESLAELLSLVSTATLEPEPIPLRVKVVLLGDHYTYYLLCELDADFADLFKVAAEFEDEIDREPEGLPLYARLIATLIEDKGLPPFRRDAVARVIEHGARLSGDTEKLSIHRRQVGDLLVEASHWAGQAGAGQVTGEHVQEAIERKIRRSDRIRDQIYEAIRHGTLMIDTAGERVGQVNGLSVLQSGDFAFGQPSRITATARLGKGEVIDVQREVELGGAIHSKGVLILSSFLGWRYARDLPLSLSASLAFEQTYGMVDGDSASVAELCALLSSISQVPIRQGLAVTGSVNQHGEVQAIGGVNEKVEAFFDVCRARGLSGDQAVLIPAANVRHLMLREDVVEAVERGEFQVHAVATVDQALELLTGLAAGEPDEAGAYPSESVNGRVRASLWDLSELQRQFQSEEAPAESEEAPAPAGEAPGPAESADG